MFGANPVGGLYPVLKVNGRSCGDVAENNSL